MATSAHAPDTLDHPGSALLLSRRDFVKLFGAGIVVFFAVRDWSLLEAQERFRQYPADFNAYLRIGEDGRVTVYSGKIEMGQGVMTSLAQMAAEELGVALAAIDMVMGDTQTCPWDMGTFGSMSTRFFGPALRGAAAEARGVLLDLAAERLRVPRERLQSADGAIHDTRDPGRSVTYAQLAHGQAIARHLAGKPRLRAPAEFTLSGTSVRRLDALAKVTGQARYAGDVRVPGMLYARVLVPPAHGATRKSVDTSAAAALPGVTVVERDDLVAVLHADPEQAARALATVQAAFDVPASRLDTETIFDHLLAVAPPPQDLARKGDVAVGAKAATAVFEHRYENGYGAHAPIETHTALADVADGKATVWTSTQTPFPDQQRIAKALGLAPERVRVITPFVGGGFGGKSSGLQAVHAARLSQAVGKPVQVAWTRAEEFFHDAFRPAALVQVRSGIDGAGRVVLWDYGVYFAGGRGAEPIYDVPNHHVRTYGNVFAGSSGAHLFAVGPWRAPGANLNVFARESQLDVMAARAQVDPLEFRLRHAADPRLRRVLDAAATRFGWKQATGQGDLGHGIACGVDAGTCVALCVEARVDRATGRVRVERMVCAQDMGQVVDPDGARMQVEGCLMMGLGYALSETLRFTGGAILDRNFDTYELPRFSALPALEAILVKNDTLAPQGGGEPAIAPVGAAIANAICDATGARLFRMPMTPDAVRKALGEAPAAR